MSSRNSRSAIHNFLPSTAFYSLLSKTEFAISCQAAPVLTNNAALCVLCRITKSGVVGRVSWPVRAINYRLHKTIIPRELRAAHELHQSMRPNSTPNSRIRVQLALPVLCRIGHQGLSTGTASGTQFKSLLINRGLLTNVIHPDRSGDPPPRYQTLTSTLRTSASRP